MNSSIAEVMLVYSPPKPSPVINKQGHIDIMFQLNDVKNDPIKYHIGAIMKIFLLPL